MKRNYRLLTSLELGPEDRTPFRGVKKAIRIAPGETLQICELEGAGRFVRIWITLPVLGRPTALTDLILRMYWDGEQLPSVQAPLGASLGATFGKPLRLVSDRLVIEGGAYACRFEMPFNNGARIELVNDSPRPVRDLFYQLSYYEEPDRTEPEPTFHAMYRQDEEPSGGAPFVALQAGGRGWLAGLRVDLQNHSW